jgi:outer membrane receptor for monomeric catechols
MGDNMPARMMPIVAITLVAFCFSDVASAANGGRSLYTQTPTQRTATWSRSAKAAKIPLHKISWKQKAARRLPADGDPYADPAAPYKANRLSSRPAQPIINIPGQTTVLTRQVIDDKNATTLRDALRTTPGVTIGR